MTDKTVESIIEKIQKCLALAGSSNPHEAAAAAAKAEELLLKHNIEMAQVEKAGSVDAQPYIRSEFPAGGASAEFSWRETLMGAVARHSLCKPLIRRRDHGLILIGKEVNIEAARYLYFYLADQVVRLSKEGWKEDGRYESVLRSTRDGWGSMTSWAPPVYGTWIRHFADGAVTAISQKLGQSQAALEAGSADTRALVVSVTRELDDATTRYHPVLGKGRSYGAIRTNSGSARALGYTAGRAINTGVQRQAPAGVLR